MNKTVLLTIGIPGCGKSTAADHMLRNTSHVIINADEIRKEFTGAEDNFSQDRAVWVKLFERFADALKNPAITHIGVTNTSINHKSRKKYYDIAEASGVDVKWRFVCFTPDVKASMKLQTLRDRAVPKDIVEGFANRYSEPHYPEPKGEVIRIDTADIVRKLML